MNLKKILQGFSLGLALTCVVTTGVQAVQAKSLLTYSGTGIWSWRSVSDFELSSNTWYCRQFR